MIQTWSQYFYDFFVNTLFGSPLLFGVFLTFIIGYFMLKLRMRFDMILIGMSTIIIFLSAYSFLPRWLLPLVVIGIGGVIGLAMLRVGKR